MSSSNLPFPLSDFHDALISKDPLPQLEYFFSQIRRKNMQKFDNFRTCIYESINRLLQIINSPNQVPLMKFNSLKTIRYFFDSCEYAVITLIEVFILPSIYQISRENYLKRSQQGIQMYFVDRGAQNTKQIRKMGLDYVELATEMIFNWAKVKPYRLVQTKELKEQSNFAHIVKLLKNKDIKEPKKSTYFIPSYPQYTRKKYLKKLKHFAPQPYISFLLTHYLEEINLNKKCDLDIKRLLFYGDAFLTSTMIEIIEEELNNMSENFINKKKYLSLLSELTRTGQIESIYFISTSEFLTEISKEVERVNGALGLSHGQYIYPKIQASKQEKKQLYIQFLRCVQIWAHSMPKNLDGSESQAFKIVSSLKKKKFVFPQNILLKKIKTQMQENLTSNEQRNQGLLKIIQNESSKFNRNEGSYIFSKGEYKFHFPKFKHNQEFLESDDLRQKVYSIKKTLAKMCDKREEFSKNFTKLKNFAQSWEDDLEKLDIEDEDATELQFIIDQGDFCIQKFIRAKPFYDQYKRKQISYQKMCKKLQFLQENTPRKKSLENSDAQMERLDVIPQGERSRSQSRSLTSHEYEQVQLLRQGSVKNSVNKSNSENNDYSLSLGMSKTTSVREKLALQRAKDKESKNSSMARQSLNGSPTAKRTNENIKTSNFNEDYYFGQQENFRRFQQNEFSLRKPQQHQSSMYRSKKSSKVNETIKEVKGLHGNSERSKPKISHSHSGSKRKLKSQSSLSSGSSKKLKLKGMDKSHLEQQAVLVQQKVSKNSIVHHSVISKSSYHSEPTQQKVKGQESSNSEIRAEEGRSQQRNVSRQSSSSIRKTENFYGKGCQNQSGVFCKRKKQGLQVISNSPKKYIQQQSQQIKQNKIKNNDDTKKLSNSAAINRMENIKPVPAKLTDTNKKISGIYLKNNSKSSVSSSSSSSSSEFRQTQNVYLQQQQYKINSSNQLIQRERTKQDINSNYNSNRNKGLRNAVELQGYAAQSQQKHNVAVQQRIGSDVQEYQFVNSKNIGNNNNQSKASHFNSGNRQNYQYYNQHIVSPINKMMLNDQQQLKLHQQNQHRQPFPLKQSSSSLSRQQNKLRTSSGSRLNYNQRGIKLLSHNPVPILEANAKQQKDKVNNNIAFDTLYSKQDQVGSKLICHNTSKISRNSRSSGYGKRSQASQSRGMRGNTNNGPGSNRESKEGSEIRGSLRSKDSLRSKGSRTSDNKYRIAPIIPAKNEQIRSSYSKLSKLQSHSQSQSQSKIPRRKDSELKLALQVKSSQLRPSALVQRKSSQVRKSQSKPLIPQSSAALSYDRQAAYNDYQYTKDLIGMKQPMVTALSTTKTELRKGYQPKQIDQIQEPQNMPVLNSYYSDLNSSKVLADTQGDTSFRSCYINMDKQTLPIDFSPVVSASVTQGNLQNFLSSTSDNTRSVVIKSQRIADVLSEENAKNSIMLYKLQREKSRIVHDLESKIKDLEQNGKMIKTKIASTVIKDAQYGSSRAINGEGQGVQRETRTNGSLYNNNQNNQNYHQNSHKRQSSQKDIQLKLNSMDIMSSGNNSSERHKESPSKQLYVKRDFSSNGKQKQRPRPSLLPMYSRSRKSTTNNISVE